MWADCGNIGRVLRMQKLKNIPKERFEMTGLVICLLGVLYIGTYFIPQPWQENYDRALAALGHCAAQERMMVRYFEGGELEKDPMAGALLIDQTVDSWGCKIRQWVFPLPKETREVLQELEEIKKEHSE